MPVVGGGHGDAGVDAAHLGGDDAGGTVPAGDRATGQQDMAAQLAAAPAEDPGPENELRVAGLVLDGYEHGAVLAPGMLVGNGPADHQHFFVLGGAFHGGGHDIRADAKGGEIAAQQDLDEGMQVAASARKYDILLTALIGYLDKEEGAMPIDVNKVYATIGEAAAAAGVSRTVVQRRVARGDLPVVKMQGPRGGRPAYNIQGADLARCFASRPRTDMPTGAPRVPPSPDLDDQIISAAVAAHEESVAMAIAAAETLPPAPNTAEAGRRVALLKTPQAAAPPDPRNPNPTQDFQRTRASRANAQDLTRRDRADRVHAFLAAHGKNGKHFSIDDLERLLTSLCHGEGLTEYEAEMRIIENVFGGKIAGEFEEMYGDPKPRGRGLWAWLMG